MADQSLIEKDIQAIIDAGGSDSDVENYLKESKVDYRVNDIASEPVKKQETIPQMLGRNAYNAYRESFSPAINMAGFGVPKAAMNAINPSLGEQIFPTPQTLIGNVAGLFGGVATGGGAYKAIESGVAKSIPTVAGELLKQKIARSAIAGGVTAAAYTPENAFRDFSSNLQRIPQAVGGAAMGALAPIIANFPKLVNLGGEKTAQIIAEKADSGMDSLTNMMICFLISKPKFQQRE